MRKTSSDYRKELSGLRKSVESIEAHIKDRLIFLINKFPDAIVVKIGIDEFKGRYLTKSWLDGLSVDEQLNYIASIEEYSKSLEPVRQLTID
jgi:hypothetical protein